MTLPTVTFSGIASPFDSNALINSLLDAQAAPLNRLKAQRTDYGAKDDAWQSVNTRLSALRTAVDDVGDLDRFVTATSSDPDAATASVTGSPSIGSMSFTVDRLATSHQEISDDTFTDPSDTIHQNGGDFTITVDGTDHTFTADGTTTYEDLAAGINGLDAGVTATILETDAGQYQLYLAADSTGDASAFDVDSKINTFKKFSTVETGVDAQLTLGSGAGAVTLEYASNSVTDLMDGVTIDLTATTASAVTVTVNRDEAAAADAVSSLVTELNATITKLDELIASNPDGASGALQGDSIARSLLNDLRSAVSSATSGSTTSGGIGIELERTGTFTFDSTEFSDALADDYDTIAAFVEDTLVVALDTELDAAEGADGVVARARDAWQARIDFVDDRIVEWEDRLDRREASLVRQFAALDSALGQLQSQSQWLAGQIAGLGAQ